MYLLQKQDDEIKCMAFIFEHLNTSSRFDIAEESDGIVRLLDLIEILLCDETEKVFVVDEINLRLHPLLTEKLIIEYLKSVENKKIQLIVTTHETKLLSFGLLRKDEIAFVNKDQTGTAHYYSITNVNIKQSLDPHRKQLHRYHKSNGIFSYCRFYSLKLWTLLLSRM